MALTCKAGNLTDLEVGDYMWCKYVASSGVVGTFSDLGTKLDADVGPLTRVCTYSHFQTSGREGWRAFDNNSDFWSVADLGIDIAVLRPWVKLDLGATISDITRVSIKARPSIPQYTPKGGLFEGSLDGTNWTTLAQFSNVPTWNTDEVKTYDITPTSFRYFRFTATDRSPNGAQEMGLAELKFYQGAGYTDVTPVLTGSTTVSTGSTIPTTGSATPNGYFKFICVERKSGKGGLLIADRGIQHSISWDTLNSGGFIEGKLNLNNLVPVMTGYTSPSGTVFASSELSGYPAWKAFNGITGDYGWLNNTGVFPCSIGYDFGTPIVINFYSIKNRDDGATSHIPTAWKFQGSNNGIDWTDLDTRSGTYWTAIGQYQTFTFNNTTAYSKYRVYITSSSSGVYANIDEMKFGYVDYLIRSMSGGCAYAGVSGQYSNTNLSQGGFPVNNDYDKFIRLSTLGEKITAGDSNVWNWNTLDIICMDTPSNGVDANNSQNTNRVTRGRLSITRFNTIASGSLNASWGFRPVLEFQEDGTIFY